MFDADVDGIDASLMLSTNRGLVDIFTDECLLSPLHGTVYNIVEELFGLRHDGQVHVSSLFPNLLNSVVDIPIHCLCVHLSQSSQAMESVLHAFWHIVHGNLGRLGPGFGSMPLNRSRISCCLLLSLMVNFLHVFRLFLSQ